MLLRCCTAHANCVRAAVAARSNKAAWPAPTAAVAAAAGGGPPRRALSMASAAAGSGGAAAPKPVLRGVVFDMDGTLTVPVIDFALMRRRVGVTQGDILDVINAWPPAERARAHAEIAAIEEQALRDMKLMPGLQRVVGLLDAAGLPRGLITRNVKSSIEYFHANHFSVPSNGGSGSSSSSASGSGGGGGGGDSPPPRPFEPAISRECAFPYKPSPAALLHICGAWGVDPREVLMVGDSAKDDVVCGNRAGARTALLDVEGRYAGAAAPAGEEAPTHTVRSMDELAELLQREYQLLPPERDAAAAAAAAGAAGAAAAAAAGSS